MMIGRRNLRTSRHGGTGDPCTGLAAVSHETPVLCAGFDGQSFVCAHCDTRNLSVDAVDVSSVIAIARGHLACGRCAELIFDADDEDQATRVVVLRDVVPMAAQGWIDE